MLLSPHSQTDRQMLYLTDKVIQGKIRQDKLLDEGALVAKKQITVYVEEDVYNKLQEMAKARRWSLNILLNWVIERLLSNNAVGGK